MKKVLGLLVTAIVLVPVLIMAGCGGDDDPGTPQGGEGCSLTVTAPLGGSEYLSGEDLRIRWEQEGGATVRIELLKGGNVVSSIASVVGREQYGWNAATLGAESGDDFSIRLTAVGEDGCGDTSDEFTIINTGDCEFNFTMETDQTFNEGDEYLLTWDSESTTGLVDIELWRMDDGDFAVGLIAADLSNSGQFLWTVDSLNEGTYNLYYFKIRDTRVTGCEAASGTFQMVDENVCEIEVTEPQPGAEWFVGDTRQIRYTALDEETTHVNISLYQGLVYCNTIAQNVAVTHGMDALDWVVDNTGAPVPLHTYRIRVSDVDDPYCVGWSADFNISSE